MTLACFEAWIGRAVLAERDAIIRGFALHDISVDGTHVDFHTRILRASSLHLVGPSDGVRRQDQVGPKGFGAIQTRSLPAKDLI